MDLCDKGSEKQTNEKIPAGGPGLEGDDEGEEYTLAPPHAKSPDEILVSMLDPELVKRAKNPSPLQESTTKDRMKLQFSLRQMMIIITFAAMGLAGAKILPNGVFVFLVGCLVMVLLFALSQLDIEDSVSRWVFLGVVTVCVAAALATMTIGCVT